MPSRLLLLACLAGLAGCAPGDSPDDAGVSADSITQRQRDSAVGASGLPGSQGVNRALDASDAAAARNAAMDSLTGGQ